MPARKDRDASITIRFKSERYGVGGIEELFPIAKLISFYESVSDSFVIGLEQPGLKSSQHYQCAVILREEAKISDDFKKKLLRYIQDNISWTFDADEMQRTLECVYTNRIKYTIGYSSKEYVAYIKGITPEFHQECIEFYNSNKRSEKSLPVSRSRLLPLIREMYDILWLELARDSDKMSVYGKYDNPKRFAVLEKMLIIRGYDLTCISPSNKREIIMNFEEYIVGNAENHLTDLDLIK